MKLYRVMRVDADGKPKVGVRGTMLGVRPTDPLNTSPKAVADVAAVNDSALVHPGEGLSTSPNPASRIARKGEAVYEIETADLDASLTPHHDKPDHCMLEPTQSITLAEYQKLLADTRDMWHKIP